MGQLGKSSFEKIQNYLLLPVLASLLSGSLVFTINWLNLGLFCLIWLSICYKRSLMLFCIGFVCSFLVCSSSFFWQSRWYEHPVGETSQEILIVEMDTVKVNGNQLQFYAKNQQEKFLVRYKLVSEKEQIFWRQQSQPMILAVSGNYQMPDVARNLHGFDYKNYLKTEKITTIFHMETYRWQSITSVSFPQRVALWRRKILLTINQTFSKKVAIYLKALLLGYKDQSFYEVEEIFSPLGLLHLFSLSGMHIQFFYGLCYFGLRRLHLTLRVSFPIMLFLSFLGVILTGKSISVLRASLAFLLTLGLKLANLQLSSLDKWSITAFLLTLLRPMAFFTVAGQLSLGISLFVVILPFSHITPNKSVNHLLNGCLLNLLLLPLVSYHFYEWSYLAGILTFFLVPCFLYFYLPGACLLLILASLHIPIEKLATIYEKGVTLIEKGLVKLSYARLVTGAFPSIFLVILLLVGCWFCLSFYVLSKRQRSTCMLLLCSPLLFKYFNPVDMVAFVDVGQGDAIVFKAAFHREITLVDTGGQLQFQQEKWQEKIRKSSSEYQLLPFLKSIGVNNLDRVILSHNDADHMGELETIVNQIQVKKIFVGLGALPESPFLKSYLQQKQGQVQEVTSGQILKGKTFTFQVLAPLGKGSGKNEDSVVLYTKIGDKGFLLTGDLDREGEKQLLAQKPDLKVDVLKVGHHGSQTSSDPDFIARIGVREGIISCGQNNRYDHPHKETLAILNEQQVAIYRTDEVGMIYYTMPFHRGGQLQKKLEFEKNPW